MELLWISTRDAVLRPPWTDPGAQLCTAIRDRSDTFVARFDDGSAMQGTYDPSHERWHVCVELASGDWLYLEEEPPKCVAGRHSTHFVDPQTVGDGLDLYLQGSSTNDGLRWAQERD